LQKGCILLLASCPVSDGRCEKKGCDGQCVSSDKTKGAAKKCVKCGGRERQILEGVQKRLRDDDQLVAAGCGDDVLNKNLEKGTWRSAYLGKLDAYLRPFPDGVHVVTIRGSTQCYWERQLLHEQLSESAALSEIQPHIKCITDFADKEQFEAWLTSNAAALTKIELTSEAQKEMDIALRNQEILEQRVLKERAEELQELHELDQEKIRALKDEVDEKEADKVDAEERREMAERALEQERADKVVAEEHRKIAENKAKAKCEELQSLYSGMED